MLQERTLTSARTAQWLENLIKYTIGTGLLSWYVASTSRSNFYSHCDYTSLLEIGMIIAVSILYLTFPCYATLETFVVRGEAYEFCLDGVLSSGTYWYVLHAPVEFATARTRYAQSNN